MLGISREVRVKQPRRAGVFVALVNVVTAAAAATPPRARAQTSWSGQRRTTRKPAGQRRRSRRRSRWRRLWRRGREGGRATVVGQVISDKTVFCVSLTVVVLIHVDRGIDRLHLSCNLGMREMLQFDPLELVSAAAAAAATQVCDSRVFLHSEAGLRFRSQKFLRPVLTCRQARSIRCRFGRRYSFPSCFGNFPPAAGGHIW